MVIELLGKAKESEFMDKVAAESNRQVKKDGSGVSRNLPSGIQDTDAKPLRAGEDSGDMPPAG